MSSELEAAKRTAQREFSASLMSDAKWRALFAALGEADLRKPAMLIKLIGSDKEHRCSLPWLDPPHPFVSIEGLGPIAIAEIEWIEFPGTVDSPRANYVPAASAIQDLDAIEDVIRGTGKHYPVKRTITGLRVLGYAR